MQVKTPAFINKSKVKTNYQDATSFVLNLLETNKKNNFRILKIYMCT